MLLDWKVNGYFKTLHLHIVDLIDEEAEELELEQDILNKHDDNIAALSLRLKQLVSKSKSPVVAPDNSKKAPARKLARLECSLGTTDDALSSTSSDPDVSLWEQHSEQLADYKKKLTPVYEELVHLDLEEDDDLFILHSKLEKLHFALAVKVRKLLSSFTSSTTSSTAFDGKGVKLPKLDVPTFGGDVLQWRQFWEQFSVSVHDRSNLSNAEKLVYLQQAVKHGTERNAIEGLS